MRNFTVGEITRHIRRLFETDTELKDVWVQGEVSNLTKARSGHWYFTIKDAKSQLRCVMFRSQAGRVRIDVRTGDEIQVHGRVSVYDARGEYQLYADKMQAVGGIGDLYAQFEALKVKLAAEGLFDKAHKQAIPPFPQQIGVVTSPSAAAWQDIQNVLRRRFPLAPVILRPDSSARRRRAAPDYASAAAPHPLYECRCHHHRPRRWLAGRPVVLQ